MKYKIPVLIFFFSIFSALIVSANMASPYIRANVTNTGLHSKDIDIEKEDLTITLSDTTIAAKYAVRYYIVNEKEKGELALIFDAAQSFDKFDVWVDGKYMQLENEKLEDVSFDKDSTAYRPIYYKQFTLVVDKGKHTIDVNYIGYPSEFLGDWVTQYTYTYNLALVKQWKTFGSLNLTIDASTIKDPVSVTLQDSVFSIQGNRATWQFDSLPQDTIDIRFLPKGDLSFMIYPEYIFWVVFIILLVINLWWSIKWRRINLTKKYTLPTILGALIVPAISIAAYIYSYPLIDHLIGKHAAHYHGYFFLVIFTYPFFAIFYFIVMWFIDHFYKVKLRERGIS